jgi:hypothetical protein
MAVTCVGVGTGQSTSSASVATSAAVTPAANRLYLAVVVSRAASSPNIPTVAGCGLTWVQVATRVDATNFRRITVFRAMKASGLSSQVVTATISGSQTVALISVLELTGMDITGTDGSGAIVTSAQNGSTTNAASGSIGMSAWADAANGAAVTAWWHGNAEVSTPDIGWTEVSDQAGTSSTCLQTQFRVGQDTATAVTWAGSATTWGGIAVEIKYAAAPVTYNDTPSGGLVLGGSVSQSVSKDSTLSGGIALGGSVSCAYSMTCGTPPVSGGIDANTVLMLHLDTPWNAVGANGTAQVDTASSVFGGSLLLDGGGYLTAPDSPAFEFGSGDFAIDFWVRIDSTAGVSDVLAKRPNAVTGFVFYRTGADLVMYASSDGASWDITAANPFATGITPGTWHHVALTRSGTTWRGFWDGVQSFIFTDSRTIVDNTYPISLGASSNGSNPLVGQLDEVRISKGTARWTANFTPPAAPYTRDANTVLLLHCDGADGSQGFSDAEAGADSSPSDHPLLALSYTPTISAAQSKFGGASLLLDPAAVYSPDSNDWDFGSGDFTIDFWWQPTTLVDCSILSQAASYARPNNAWVIGVTDYAKSLEFDYSTDGTTVIQCYTGSSFIPVVGTWYHIAAVRSGTSLKLYVNGTQNGPTYSISGAIFNPAEPLIIGARTIDGPWNFVRCYLDEVRISKGIARWTSNFTPPSAPYTSGGAGGVGLTGGIVLNGSCSSSFAGAVITSTPSGGIVLGGSQTSDRALSLAQTGGIVLGGSAVTVKSLAYTVTPSGGLVLGGSVTQSTTRASTPSGGILLGGSADTQISNASSLSPSGGIVLGGSAALAGVAAPAPSGGLVLGGSVVVVYTSPGPIYNYAPSGGLALGGSVTQTISFAYTGTGGIVLGGSAATVLVPPGPTYICAPSGGIQLSGTCTSSITTIYNLAPVGGIVFGGVSGTAGEAVALPPIVDRSDGGWTDQTGGTELYAAIDETAPVDTDYIKSTSNPVTADICEVGFQPAVDPFSSSGHVLTYRYGSEAEGWTTVTQTLSAAQADAITQYGQISVKFEAKV